MTVPMGFPTFSRPITSSQSVIFLCPGDCRLLTPSLSIPPPPRTPLARHRQGLCTCSRGFGGLSLVVCATAGYDWQSLNCRRETEVPWFERGREGREASRQYCCWMMGVMWYLGLVRHSPVGLWASGLAGNHNHSRQSIRGGQSKAEEASRLPGHE